EGQRRYIESFSPYTRQFLDQLEKPEAELIDGIPPAICVAGNLSTKSSRATVGTATETYDFLRLLYSKIGITYCISCGHEVRRDTSETVTKFIALLPLRTRFLVVWHITEKHESTWAEQFASMREEGFIRVLLNHQMVDLSSEIPSEEDAQKAFDASLAAHDKIKPILEQTGENLLYLQRSAAPIGRLQDQYRHQVLMKIKEFKGLDAVVDRVFDAIAPLAGGSLYCDVQINPVSLF
ncbi:MAG: hypothetical protein J6X30_03745, partial [Clostridia bacterium]|nr:hypothetical protein [Clostridia bacterium]